MYILYIQLFALTGQTPLTTVSATPATYPTIHTRVSSAGPVPYSTHTPLVLVKYMELISAVTLTSQTMLNWVALVNSGQDGQLTWSVMRILDQIIYVNLYLT
jgi:hypothetical protein